MQTYFSFLFLLLLLLLFKDLLKDRWKSKSVYYFAVLWQFQNSDCILVSNRITVLPSICIRSFGNGMRFRTVNKWRVFVDCGSIFIVAFVVVFWVWVWVFGRVAYHVLYNINRKYIHIFLIRKVPYSSITCCLTSYAYFTFALSELYCNLWSHIVCIVSYFFLLSQ